MPVIAPRAGGRKVAAHHLKCHDSKCEIILSRSWSPARPAQAVSRRISSPIPTEDKTLVDAARALEIDRAHLTSPNETCEGLHHAKTQRRREFSKQLTELVQKSFRTLP